MSGAAAVLIGVGLFVTSCGANPIKPDPDGQGLLPIVAALPLLGGDPKVVGIGVAWSSDGYCPEQLQVTAVETSATVTVSDVYVVSGGPGPCAGVGVVNHTAWAVVRLKSPAGARQWFRKRDGAVLPSIAH